MAMMAAANSRRSASGSSVRITQGEPGMRGLFQMIRTDPGGIIFFSSMRWMLPRASLVQKVGAASNVPFSTEITESSWLPEKPGRPKCFAGSKPAFFRW